MAIARKSLGLPRHCRSVGTPRIRRYLSSGLTVVYALETGDLQASEIDAIKGVYKAKTKEQTGVYLKLEVSGRTAAVKKAQKLKLL